MTNHRLYIAFLVLDPSDISGGNRVIFEHAEILQNKGHNVEIWQNGEAKAVYYHESLHVRSAEIDIINEPDILVLTDPGFIPLSKAYRKKRATYLLIQHDNEWVSEITGSNTYSHYLKSEKEYFSKGECQIIVVSEWLRDVVWDKYGLSALVIQNGVDTRLFRPAEPLLRSDEPIVLTVYDPQIWKGFQDAILTIQDARQKKFNIQIAIIGKYFPEVPHIEGMSFGFPFPAIYLNRPLQASLAGIYSSASVFISASWAEGFGLPGLEAMACGVPLVTTDSGGNRDYVQNNKNALVREPKDIAGLSEALIHVLSDKSLQQDLKTEGLKTAEKLSWPKANDKLEKVFRSDYNHK